MAKTKEDLLVDIEKLKKNIEELQKDKTIINVKRLERRLANARRGREKLQRDNEQLKVQIRELTNVNAQLQQEINDHLEVEAFCVPMKAVRGTDKPVPDGTLAMLMKLACEKK
jgi:septal ring factor EnvC (AmiA/AmiB activator)